MSSEILTDLPRGTKRGYGSCKGCGKQYITRRKPKFCDCGFDLGGSFVKKDSKSIVRAPSSVAVYENSCGTLRSVKLTPKDERQFAFTNQNDRICFAKNCLSLRASFPNSGKINDFNCKHLQEDIKNSLYAVSFTAVEIKESTPDRAM